MGNNPRAHPSDQALVPTASSQQVVSTKGFDPSRVKYVQDIVAALSEQSNRAAKAERQVRDLTAENVRLRAEADKIGPLVEFFRGEGFWPFGHTGDYEGWSPEETAIHFLRGHHSYTPDQGTAPNPGESK